MGSGGCHRLHGGVPREDPGAKKDKPHHGDEKVRAGQHQYLDAVVTTASSGLEQPQRTTRHSEAGKEDREFLQLVAEGMSGTGDPEREPPVRRCVADRGHEQGQQVGGLRGDRAPEPEVHDSDPACAAAE